MSSSKSESSRIEDVEANILPKSIPAAVVPARLPSVDGSILGLYSFGGTCIVISLYNCRAADITIPNAIVGLALALGGLGQFIGGIFELIRGVAYTGTLFVFYSTFWLSLSAYYIPSSGVADAYAQDAGMFGNAVGIYFIMYSFLTVIFLLVGLRKNVAIVITLSLLTITFLMLGIANFTGSASVSQAAGVIGVLTGLAALYVGTAGLLALEPRPIFTLPVGVIG